MKLILAAVFKSFELWFHSRYLKSDKKKANHPSRCSICQEELFEQKIMTCYQFRGKTRKSIKKQDVTIREDKEYLDHKTECQRCTKFFAKNKHLSS